MGDMVRNPIASHSALVRGLGKGVILHDTETLTAKDLSPVYPLFFHAITGPCLVIAAVSKDPDGKIQNAVFSHLSTNFHEPEIYSFLSGTGMSPKTSFLRVMGMAQKANPEELKLSTERLKAGIESFGIPLFWNNTFAEQPFLYDVRNGEKKLISDLGMGLLSDPDKRMFSRFISMGISADHMIAISTSMFRQQKEHEFGPLVHCETKIFIENDEVLTIR